MTTEQRSDLDLLAMDLSVLYNNKDTADVIFVVGEEQVAFHAHKLLLWARCRNFKKYEQQFWRSRTSSGPLTFTYPQFKPSVFGVVLEYIYTGDINLSETLIYPILLLSQEFGIPSLNMACERYVVNNLSGDNACLFLVAALDVQKHIESCERGAEYNIEVASLSYIEQHAANCLSSPGWLKIPKQAIIRLLSSKHFQLEEEDIWRAVLTWAKYNTNVPQDKHHTLWNMQEKAGIKKALDGVIEHVKFLLIDSKVFAEEVEPLGVVPIELSLEKYRTAAVPQSDNLADERLHPRLAQEYFRESQILMRDLSSLQRMLNQWYGKSKQVWKLLYRASSNGFAAADFHKNCDGHSPTFVIIKGASGNICGGFTDTPWSSSTQQHGRFLPSHRSFLFTLINKQDIPPSKFDVFHSKYAIAHHRDFGPIFGAGADLCIADNCNVNMESYSNLPHSYDGPNASCSILMGDYNFTVADYEVFAIDHQNNFEI